jgi:hypothetical protein
MLQEPPTGQVLRPPPGPTQVGTTPRVMFRTVVILAGEVRVDVVAL